MDSSYARDNHSRRGSYRGSSSYNNNRRRSRHHEQNDFGRPDDGSQTQQQNNCRQTEPPILLASPFSKLLMQVRDPRNPMWRAPKSNKTYDEDGHDPILDILLEQLEASNARRAAREAAREAASKMKVDDENSTRARRLRIFSNLESSDGSRYAKRMRRRSPSPPEDRGTSDFSVVDRSTSHPAHSDVEAVQPPVAMATAGLFGNYKRNDVQPTHLSDDAPIPEYDCTVYEEDGCYCLKAQSLLWLWEKWEKIPSLHDVNFKSEFLKLDFAVSILVPFLSHPSGTPPEALSQFITMGNEVLQLFQTSTNGQLEPDDERKVVAKSAAIRNHIYAYGKRVRADPSKLGLPDPIPEISSAQCRKWFLDIIQQGEATRRHRVDKLEQFLNQFAKHMLDVEQHPKIQNTQLDGDPRWAEIMSLSNWMSNLRQEIQDSISLCKELFIWCGSSIFGECQSQSINMAFKHEAVARNATFASMIWTKILPAWQSSRIIQFKEKYMATAILFVNEWDEFSALWKPAHESMKKAFCIPWKGFEYANFPLEDAFNVYVASQANLPSDQDHESTEAAAHQLDLTNEKGQTHEFQPSNSLPNQPMASDQQSKIDTQIPAPTSAHPPLSPDIQAQINKDLAEAGLLIDFNAADVTLPPNDGKESDYLDLSDNTINR